MADRKGSTFVPGLEGVVAVRTRLSDVDGTAGRLVIAGFPIEEIAERASFEEVLHLLWYDALPGVRRLAAFRKDLADRRRLSETTTNLLRNAAAGRMMPMDALRMAAGTLDPGPCEKNGGEPRPGEIPRGGSDEAFEQAMTAVARMPTVVAAYWRMLEGKHPVEPDPGLHHAANYLYMLTGERPTPERSRALETYLNTVCDHGMNASTFASRVIISTRSDMVSALVGAVGALKGPLHGGAPGPALDVVFEIGEPERAEPVLRQKLERGERLMGFGHRIYKVRDPRADVLGAAADRLYGTDADRDLYELARGVEKTAIRLLEEYKPGRNLDTNVEFYTALLLHGLGLPTELFTPTFAVGRSAGWMAHCFEQMGQDRIIRPQSEYTGAEGRRWIPAEQR